MSPVLRSFFSFFAVVLFALQLPAVVLAGELRGRVVSVADGDTIDVVVASGSSVVVRLANVDAPETSCYRLRKTCTEAKQPFGLASALSLADLVAGKSVRIVTIDGKRSRSYGRIVGTVFVGDIDANLEQVRRGFAWHYTDYAKRQQSSQAYSVYAAAERSARGAAAGLWVDRSPVPPWDFRRHR